METLRVFSQNNFNSYFWVGEGWWKGGLVNFLSLYLLFKSEIIPAKYYHLFLVDEKKGQEAASSLPTVRQLGTLEAQVCLQPKLMFCFVFLLNPMAHSSNFATYKAVLRRHLEIKRSPLGAGLDA